MKPDHAKGYNRLARIFGVIVLVLFLATVSAHQRYARAENCFVSFTSSSDGAGLPGCDEQNYTQSQTIANTWFNVTFVSGTASVVGFGVALACARISRTEPTLVSLRKAKRRLGLGSLLLVLIGPGLLALLIATSPYDDLDPYHDSIGEIITNIGIALSLVAIVLLAIIVAAGVTYVVVSRLESKHN